MIQQTIEHPLVGDRVTFLRTGRETNGEYLHVQVELVPGGGNGLHFHTRIRERFEVRQGLLGLHCDGKEYVLSPGESMEVPPYAMHRFYNPSVNEKVVFLVTMTPAARFEQCLRVAYGLATDGLCKPSGFPKSFWHLALMAELGESYFPGLPAWLQQGLYGALATMARWLGKDRALRKYLGESADVRRETVVA